MIGEVAIGARDGGPVALKVFRFELDTVGGEQEAHLPAVVPFARAQSLHRLTDLARGRDQDVDVVALEHAAHVRLVHVPRAQLPDTGIRGAERLQEGVGELRAVEGLRR